MKRRKQITMPSSAWDEGATGPANRHGLVREAATDIDPETGKETPNPNNVMRMRRVDMLEVWARKGRISAAGYNAADKLRRAYLATFKAPGWPDNDRVQSSPKPDHAVTIQIERLSDFHEFWKVVVAADRAIIGWCILHDHSAATLRDDRGRRPYYGHGHAAGMKHLREALDRLAEKIGG